METRAFCVLLSVWRLACGATLCLADAPLVVWCFGALEVAMATMSAINAIKAEELDATARGIVPPLIYTAGLYVQPAGTLNAQIEAALWLVVAFRLWCVVALNLSVSCGLSTFWGIKTRGPYAYLRHPMQLSGILARVAFCAAWPVPLNFAGLFIMTAGSVLVVIAEESFLRQQKGWADYTQRVRYRLVPGVW